MQTNDILWARRDGGSGSYNVHVLCKRYPPENFFARECERVTSATGRTPGCTAAGHNQRSNELQGGARPPRHRCCRSRVVAAAASRAPSTPPQPWTPPSTCTTRCATCARGRHALAHLVSHVFPPVPQLPAWPPTCSPCGAAPQMAHQVLNLAMIVCSALMIWKSLMVVTESDSPVVVVLRRALRPSARGTTQ